MLSQAQRTAILELSGKAVSHREIARVLQVSRATVRKVLTSNSTQVPEIQRAEKAEPYRQQILDLLASCKGNLVRVHEELTAAGAALSYPALTAFCRRQGIGQTPIVAAGQYHFEPGVEMQHDTSPHTVEVGGSKYKAQSLHPRTVDVEGYVSVNSVRYSVPAAWIGRRVEARETRDKIEIELDARHLVTHVRAVTPQSQRITLAEHRPPRGEGVKRGDPHPGWGDAEAGKRLYESAITAAEAVGDDRLQAKATLFYAVEELRTRSESAINITAKAINLASAFQEADFDVLRSRLDDAIRECNNSATA